MYLIIAYHGKGKKEVEEDLKRLWFNYSNFVKFVKVQHVYFFQNARDDKGADLVMIIEYQCARSCSGTQLKCGMPKQRLGKKCGDVNYWFYTRGKGYGTRGMGQESRDKGQKKIHGRDKGI
jgi:hypothetical protein